MRKGVIILIFLCFIFSISFGISLKIKNDETIYALLDSDGKVKRIDLVNWISLEGKGNFKISKDKKYLNDIKIYTEDVKMNILNDKIIFSGVSAEYKNIYISARINRKLPLDFKISYRYNGKFVKPRDFLGKDGNLDIEIYIKPNEDIPFRVVMSTEFSADDFVLKNPEDFMVMVMGKNVRLSAFTYPIPDSKLKLSLRGKKLKVPAITFTALPSLPPVDLSMKDQLYSFNEGIESFLLLNQAHQKILKGILEGIEKNTPTIPQEYLTLPFALMANQNKAYLISKNIKEYPKSFNNLYGYIKEKAESSNDEDWKKALMMAEEVKKEIETNSFSDDIKNIGDFIGDLAFQSKKAMDMIGISLQGIQNIENMLNIMLYGGEIEGKKLPGLSDMEKNLKTMKEKIRSNISLLEKGEEKINSWKKRLENYVFAGEIPNAKSAVRFYFRLNEIK